MNFMKGIKKLGIIAISLLGIVFSVSAAVALYTKSANSATFNITGASSSEIIDNSGFFNVTEFNSPVEIHTSAQATYLAYSGDYDTMPSNQYPDGTTHQSDSLPVAVSWDYNVPAGKSVTNYSVIYGKESDLSDGYTLTVTSKSANLVNPYLGRNYFKLVANLNDGSHDESIIRHFDVDDTCPRNLTIEGMTNCRDIGGRLLEDGGRIKQGLVFRTSGKNQNGSLTSATTEEMVGHLKMKTEINVADSSSYNLSSTIGTTLVELKMDYGSSSNPSRHHFSRNTENVKNFFNLLADTSYYPVYFHCRIGTDRTGLCAILLNGLLGVPLNEIYQDYLFSNFGKIGEKRYIGSAAGQDNIMNYINEIKSLSGETFKNKVYNALLAIGVTRTTLDTVIANLTEGTPAQNNNAGQIVATGDMMVGSGVSVTHDTSQRDNPDYYFKLNNNTSASYTFTASEDYEGQIVAYLGNYYQSTSAYIDQSISCKIDSTNVTVNHINYSEAGMGHCSSRTNYYFVVLGTADITIGTHTITISGITSTSNNVLNLGTICIYGASTGGGGGGGDDPQPEHTTHSYVAQTPITNNQGKTVTTYLCECGKKYIAINFTDYSELTGSISDGTQGKLTNGAVVKWDIPAKAGTVKLQFAMRMSWDSHSSTTFYTSSYGVKINNVAQTILLTNGATYGSLGLTTSEQYFDFVSYDVVSDGMNLNIEFDHNNGSNRLLFSGQVRLMYEI